MVDGDHLFMFIILTAATVVAANDALPSFSKSMSMVNDSGHLLEGGAQQLLLHNTRRGDSDGGEQYSIPLTAQHDQCGIHHLFGPIRVGGKVFEVSFNFASSLIWLFGKQADPSIKDDFHRTYYEEELPDDAEPFFTDYKNQRRYDGFKAYDTVEIGGIKIPRREVGVAHTVTQEEKGRRCRNFGLDGEVGLGVLPCEPVSNRPCGQQPPFIQMMLLANVQPRFALHMADDGESGELLFGAVSTTRYHDPITYVPVVDTDSPFWTITLGAFGIGKEKALVQNVPVGIYFETPSMLAPRSVLQGIIDSSKGAAEWADDSKTVVTMKCSKRDILPSIYFLFNGVPHEFTSEEYFPENKKFPGMCQLFMLPSEAVFLEGKADSVDTNPPRWILGLPYFKKFFMIYQRKLHGGDGGVGYGNWEIGFALASDTVRK